MGAIDYVSKLFSAPLLLKRIENHLLTQAQKQQLRELNEHLEEKVKENPGQVIHLQDAVLQTVADLVEFRDDGGGRGFF